MKYILVLLLSLSALHVYAQNSTSIVYKTKDITDQTLLFHSRHVFNDSFSLYYFYREKDPLKKSLVFGDKIIHHGIFADRINKIRYEENDFPAGDPFIQKVDYKKEEWTTLPATKMIMGYQCNGLVKGTEGKDKITVWYTNQLGSGFGNAYFNNLPGVCLQVYDQKYGWVIKAKEIKKGSCKLVFPDQKLFRKGDGQSR